MNFIVGHGQMVHHTTHKAQMLILVQLVSISDKHAYLLKIFFDFAF